MALGGHDSGEQWPSGCKRQLLIEEPVDQAGEDFDFLGERAPADVAVARLQHLERVPQFAACNGRASCLVGGVAI